MTPGPTLPEWIAVVEADAVSADPLDQLAAASAAVADLDRTREEILGHFVDRCRGTGRTWTEISSALGVTKQAAHRRFAMSDTIQTSRFTPRALVVLERAPEIARTLGHPAVGTEHLLLAILEDPESLASRVLAARGVDHAAVRTAALLLTPKGDEPDGVLPLTPRAVTAVKGALTVALELGHNYVGTEHQLVALVREPEAAATRILAAADFPPDDVRTDVVALVNQLFQQRKNT